VGPESPTRLRCSDADREAAVGRLRVAAVVCGHIALGQIRESGGRQSGRGLAIAGLALGYFELLMLVLALIAIS
jgi:hypothetical protein